MDELRGVVTYAATDPTAGGIATISSGSGNTLVMGGTGANVITGGVGDDVLLGANGTATFANGLITSVTSADPTEGGNDTITAGTGYNLIIGGPGKNTLAGSTGPDVILGANGSIVATSGSASIFQGATVKSTSPGVGGSDTITGGSGHQILIGGPGSDTITGGSGTGLIFGGDAQVTLSGTTVASYASIDIGPSGGGTDTIHAGNGSATIYGGPGNDTITGGPGTDVINGGDTVANGASGFDQILGATSTDTLTFDFTLGIPASSHPAFAFQDTTDFTTGIPSPFGSTSGLWSLASGSYQGTPSGGQAVSLFAVKSQQVHLRAAPGDREHAGRGRADLRLRELDQLQVRGSPGPDRSGRARACDLPGAGQRYGGIEGGPIGPGCHPGGRPERQQRDALSQRRLGDHRELLPAARWPPAASFGLFASGGRPASSTTSWSAGRPSPRRAGPWTPWPKLSP